MSSWQAGHSSHIGHMSHGREVPVSAHLRRRGRHAQPRQVVFTVPPAGALGPAALGFALTAGVVGSPPGSSASTVELLSAPRVASPQTPLGFPDSIEGFASYVPQHRCAPTARLGVLAFERLVLRTYPNTSSDGIV